MPGNNGNTVEKGGSHGEQKPTLSWSTPAHTSAPAAKPVATVIKESKNAAVSKMKPSTRKMVAIFVGSIAALVVIIGGFIWLGAKNAQPIAGAPAQSQTGAPIGGQEVPAAAPVSIGGLTIPSPQSAGLQVAVSNVSVSSPTWVVVYENHNGEPGNALGAALFTPERTSGAVELLRGTLPGQTYFAGEARDDGDHMFSLQNDPAVRDENGNPLWLQFQTR